MVQTRDGYLWLGTEEGLARFDGVRFTVFDRANTEAIQNNFVRALLEDRAGNLWIGTYGGGVTRLRNGTASTFTDRDGLAHNRVYALLEDRAGVLWVGTAGGLSRLQSGRFTTETWEGLHQKEVRAIAQDGDGTVWVGTADGRLSRFKEGGWTNQAIAGLGHDAIRAIYTDRANRVWIGTDGSGLASWKNGRASLYTVANGLSSDKILSIIEDRDGSLWVGTEAGGVNRLAGGRFFGYSLKEGLSNAFVASFCEDREGSLWVGTYGGLNRFSDGSFTTYGTREGLSYEIASSVLEDHQKTLWIGTWGGGLNRLRAGQFTAFTSRDGLSSDEVSALAEGRDGSLWVGTWGGGLNHFQNGRFRVLTTGDGLPHSEITCLWLDRRDALWIGTYGGGLARLSGGRLTSYAMRDGLPDNVVRSIFEGADGALWIGTNSGLARLQDGRFDRFTVRDGLSSDAIYSLYEDRGGVLWIGTLGGGLNRFEAGRFTVYSTRQGLSDNTVFRILEDDSGHLWMSSNKGIFRVRKRELEDLAKGRISSMTSVAFGTADGMESSECMGGTQPVGWKSPDGRLWFATVKGVVAVDPAHWKRNSVPPPVRLEEFVADKQRLDPRRAVRLSPGPGTLEFHYTAASFLAPEKVRFRYRLEGFDKEWVDAGTRRVAYYTNTPPGPYRFRVIACNNDGVWNASGATLEFSLRPHFYQTGWFYGLCAVSALCLATGGYKLRVRELTRRKAELVRVVAERTEQLGETNRRLEQALLAEGRVHALERELASVVQHAREAIVTWGLDGRIVSWNPAAETLYRLRADEAIGRSIETLVPESARPQFRLTCERLLAGEKVSIAEAYRVRNGGEIQVEERLFLLPEVAGRPARVASIARDLSEIMRLRRTAEILAGADRYTEADSIGLPSPAMEEVLEAADRSAQDPYATILLTGETGVGKGWLARRIHAKSPRAQKPFFEINCASLARELVESELFGHERGAFTGAATLKQGLVEVADGGTIFLDEVSELPAGVQAQLLNFLDNRLFRRVGGTRTLIADVRILAATNADLKQAVEQGAFRKDLYFRLSVFPIRVPPLRERRGEIPALASAVVCELAQRTGRREVSISAPAMAALCQYPWPGNVRELRNALERALILSRERLIELAHLSPEIREEAIPVRPPALQLENVEHTHILRVLEQVQGNRTRAAQILGISRSTLKRKIHGTEPGTKRTPPRGGMRDREPPRV